MKFNNTQRIAAQHAASAVLGYKKNALSILYREDESCPCYHFCSFLPRGQKPYRVRFHPDFPIQSGRSVIVLIPFRYNRRSCCSLNVNLISTAPLPSHLPSAPALPSQPRKSEISSGEFSVMWSANVLSCSLSLLIFCGNSCFRFFRNSSIFTHICKLRISAANPRNPLFPKQSRPNFPGQ